MGGGSEVDVLTVSEEVVGVDDHVGLEQGIDDDDFTSSRVEPNVAWVVGLVFGLDDGFSEESRRHSQDRPFAVLSEVNRRVPWLQGCCNG